MSVFLTCQLLDSFRSRDPIPTTLFLGIREPGEQVGRRDEREGWVWQRWEREYTFAGGCEFWECTTFPSFDTLFGNDRIRAIDALVLSIQIQTPVQANAPAPQLEHYHYVPRDLLRGLEALFDDPLTSDVVILCCERSVDEDGTTPMFRKRSLHTHSSILRSRSSSFFGGMLNDGAPWREGDEDKERKRSIVRIRDFDYVTLHALVHWLYTNEVTFTPIEDARSIPSDDLPETWLSESPDSGWGWFAQDGAACEAPSAPTAQAPSSPSAKKKNSKGKRSAVASMAVRRSSTPERDTSAASAAGRLSPLGAVSPTTLRSVSAPVPETAKVDKDPHHHPSHSIEPASALAIYKLAHRMELQNLADLALCHIVQTLTPRTAFPLLLSTFLWGDLYSAIKVRVRARGTRAFADARDRNMLWRTTRRSSLRTSSPAATARSVMASGSKVAPSCSTSRWRSHLFHRPGRSLLYPQASLLLFPARCNRHLVLASARGRRRKKSRAATNMRKSANPTDIALALPRMVSSLSY